MRYDQQAIRDAERLAFRTITATEQKGKNAEGVICKIPNKYWVNPLNVTMPMKMVQEVAWVNTNQELIFDFSINAPNQIPGTNNNVILGQNNVFVGYGIQILFGDGADAANRIYRSRGLTPNDDALYNSLVSVRMEQSTLIDKVNGQDFRDVETSPNEFYATAGMMLINPIRIVSGKLGTFSLAIRMLNPFSTLVISADQFVSVRLLGAYGQASA